MWVGGGEWVQRVHLQEKDKNGTRRGRKSERETVQHGERHRGEKCSGTY